MRAAAQGSAGTSPACGACAATYSSSAPVSVRTPSPVARAGDPALGVDGEVFGAGLRCGGEVDAHLLVDESGLLHQDGGGDGDGAGGAVEFRDHRMSSFRSRFGRAPFRARRDAASR